MSQSTYTYKLVVIWLRHDKVILLSPDEAILKRHVKAIFWRHGDAISLGHSVAIWSRHGNAIYLFHAALARSKKLDQTRWIKLALFKQTLNQVHIHKIIRLLACLCPPRQKHYRWTDEQTNQLTDGHTLLLSRGLRLKIHKKFRLVAKCYFNRISYTVGHTLSDILVRCPSVLKSYLQLFH